MQQSQIYGFKYSVNVVTATNYDIMLINETLPITQDPECDPKKPTEAKEPHLHWKKEGSKDTEFESVATIHSS